MYPFELFVSAVVSSVLVAVKSCFVLKKSCVNISLGLGRFLGLYCSIHSIKFIASFDALGMILSSGTLGYSGIKINLRSASRFASGHSSLLGHPSTLVIFSSWSSSELPGNRGLKVYSSAIMQPKAKISTG